LNTVSRTRSGVGRSPGRSGKFTRRPRQAPAMMRRVDGPGSGAPRFAGRAGFGGLTAGIIRSVKLIAP
jgi:hypothetical protein